MIRVLFALCLLLLAPLALAAGGTDTSIFTIPLNDQSILFLSEIFGKVGNVIGGSTSNPLRDVILLFNNIALVVGGFIILYAIVVSTINTANDGELLGKKWNSVWIPMRVAIGFGLLLPAGANGYAFIQIIVMWIVVQGVGAANYIWGQYLKNVALGNANPQQPYVSANTMNSISLIFQNASCSYARASVANAQNQLPAGIAASNILPVTQAIMNVQGSKIQFGVTQGDTTTYNCGSVTLNNTTSVPPSSKTLATNNQAINQNSSGACPPGSSNCINSGTLAYLYKNQPGTVKGGIQTYLSSLSGQSVSDKYQAQIKLTMAQSLVDISRTLYNLADEYVNKSNYCTDNTDRSCVNNIQRQIMTQAENYVAASTTYTEKINTYDSYSSQSKSSLVANAQQSFLYQAQQFGWVYAGSYYIVLSYLGAEVAPQMIPAPTVTGLTTLNPDAPTEIANIAGYIQAISRVCGADTTSTDQTTVPCIPNQLNTSGPASVTSVSLFGDTNNLASIGSGFNNSVTDWLTSYLAAITETGANPIVSLSNAGTGIFKSAVVDFVAAGTAIVIMSGLTSMVPFLGKSGTAAINTTIDIFILPVLALVGAMCGWGMMAGYYIPLIPYFLFTFGALGWLFLVIEAMVAAPILALGIIHPEGGHDIWGKSETGISMLLGIFLRPALMIIGFVASNLLIYVVFSLINGGFYTAIVLLHIGVLGLLSIMMIYIGMVTYVSHQCFRLIYKLPDQILRWIGGTPESVGSESDQELSQGQQKISGAGDAAGKSFADGVGKSQDVRDRTNDAKEDKKSSKTEETTIT